MAEVLVTFYSVTHKTEKMAEAVAEGARRVGATVTVEKIEEVCDNWRELPDYDAMIIGSPTYYGSAAPQVLELFRRANALKIRSALQDKVGAAFATTGHPTGGGSTCVISILQALLIMGMIVVGDPPVIIKGKATSGHYGPIAAGTDRPDVAHGGLGIVEERALEEARLLGERVATLAERLYG